MTERGKRFCREYALGGEAKGAAVRAGYDPLHARQTAERLLKTDEAQKEIAQWKSNTGQAVLSPEKLSEQIEQMLCRIAFSGDSAAFRAMQLSPKSRSGELEGIDLLRVSELSLSGDGKITVKFIDRFKAFQMLAELAERKQTSGDGGSLSAAIRESIAAVNGRAWTEGGGPNGD